LFPTRHQLRHSGKIRVTRTREHATAPVPGGVVIKSIFAKTATYRCQNGPICTQ
jgi:hypothetical protein